jgi:DNA helicase-2/ATP-dependent DNA helicase PcrA
MDSLKVRFTAARRSAIAQTFRSLNPEQLEGALTTEGPLLLLAGAGSGKPTVLIHRIANLLRFGRGSDCDEVPPWVTEEDTVFLERCAGGAPCDDDRLTRLCAVDPAPPWSVLAITFTNRAANELKARLEQMLGPAARDIWASTFHSACLRILRREIDRLGFSRSFTIYDDDDSVHVIKDVLKELNLDDKLYPPKTVLGYISRAKDAMQDPEQFSNTLSASGDFRLRSIARIYESYQRRLREADALDFDDLIYCTVLLLQKHEDVRRRYQNQFRYVLVDEYQDTNRLQYRLTALLAGGHRNLCVVGDDDQSIYRFRGATIENILSFEEQFPGARVIRLEQNYRSTQNILKAANAVIANNLGRKGKNLWTKHPAGARITLHTAMDEKDEAQYVAGRLLAAYAQGRPWKDHAILYRMNAQSNQLEYAFKRNGIPYRVFGGIRFFDRAEIKDMLAYLILLHNPADDLRLKRIINSPPRGIGARTVELASDLAAARSLPLFEIVRNAQDYPELRAAAPRLSAFAQLLESLRALAQTMPLPDLYEELMEKTVTCRPWRRKTHWRTAPGGERARN